MTRQLHLGVFIYPGGHHIAAWRHPNMRAERITELDYYIEAGQLAERGKFDLFFVGDALNARETHDERPTRLRHLHPASRHRAAAGEPAARR